MKKKLPMIIGVILLIAAIGAAVYFYMQWQESEDKYDKLNKEHTKLTSDPQAAQAAEVQKYVDEVGKLYDLPDDEKPSVATVKDKEQLKDQAFFAKAENGDITLIYSNAKLALLYRPSTKQLVNVSTVTIQQETQPTPETQPAQ